MRQTTPMFLPLAALAMRPVALAGSTGEKNVCRDLVRFHAGRGRRISLTASR